MPHQSEEQLEKTLIKQLNRLGFLNIAITERKALKQNLKNQLEKFNKTKFSKNEFIRILNHLNKGDRFEKAKTLRDRFLLKRDDETTDYIKFFNTNKWCKNEYQVARQITQQGHYENRYDVTLLINGLPLVQIELKRRGMEMKEAFNQIQRYHKHSFSGTLFEYVQVFVISNGVNTKYFANNPKQSFEQTFHWTDFQNKKISKLEDFANDFLEKCSISQFISEYIVLAEAQQIPMVLRPYQYYAARAIEKQVKSGSNNGYIWHTTGSGKTLTSFKASQTLSKMPEVEKVLFVVDRKDLDVQTTKEFNSFSDGSVDGTDNTKELVRQLKNKNRSLVVTTVQKLDIAIKRNFYLKQLEYLRDKKVIIIFDECHRGQFGKTQARIEEFFKNVQMFGFTGTPIFAKNNIGGVTTADVFGECLHKYIITNAITDNNVLGFAIEYVGKYKQKDLDVVEKDIFSDIEIKKINKKEVFESSDRLNKISNYILEDWSRKTKKGIYNALFAVSSIDVLKKYYTLLKKKKSDNFSLATIFTYYCNEEENESADLLEADIFKDEEDKLNNHSRDFLEECINDYNKEYGTNFSTNNFYGYYQDLQERIKNRQVDLVIVVNMFLTGFDSKKLNTLYLDKNLRYHGLIQAYSRTNRLDDSNKPHGNIITFRNLKRATDKALALFGDENAKETVFKKPYEKQREEFEEVLKGLYEIAPTFEAIDKLLGEEEKSEFIKVFRNLLRLKSSLETFAEFSFDDLNISEQEFYNYQSKYLDLYDERKRKEDKGESIIDQIDFELELTVRDIVDRDYIIQLIIGLKEATSGRVREKKTKELMDILDRNVRLRKKKELIKKFIEENLPSIKRQKDIEKAFNNFWEREQLRALREVIEEENLTLEDLEQLMADYFYTGRLPHGEEIIDKLPESKKPRLLERQRVIDRIKKAIENIVEVFEW